MNNAKAARLLKIVGIPILFALVIRWLFGVDSWESLFSVMSIGFIFLLPVGVGAITIYLSSVENVKSFAFRFFMPWLPVLGFFFLTLLFSLEGMACWIMILPVFLLASSIGGLIAGYFKLRKKNEKVYVSLIALLPFLISPVEQALGTIPGEYKAYTCIDIQAPKERIWSNVTKVKTISQEEDKGWFTRDLGFPRPIRAELNYEGVGAYRKAIFDKGLVFHETVISYAPEQKMVFTIKANPHEIPSTTMDQHIVVGGDFFDVLNGTYELQKVNSTTYRLHLYSHFKMATTFNFYSSWWAKWIMKGIQQNILQVIKRRSEDLTQ